MKVRVEPSWYSNNAAKVYSDFGPLEQSHTDVDILAGFGTSRVFADKIVVDFGYNLNVIAFTATLFDGINADFSSNRTLQNYIEKTSKQRARGVNRFNIFLSE